MKKKLGFLQKCQQKQMVSRNWKKTRNLGGVKRSIKAVPRGPPIWIWILVFPKITKEFLYFILLEKNQNYLETQIYNRGGESKIQI